MISRNDRTSPFGIFLYFDKGEIDKMCESELRKASLLPKTPQPIDIELFIEGHLKCSLEYGDWGTGVLGITAFDSTGKPKAVGLAASLDDGSATGQHRVRSTAAHEAGHCILHPTLFMQASLQKLPFENFDPKERRILCRDRDMSGTQATGTKGRWWEYQANRAIGGFLVPKSLAQPIIDPFLHTAGLLGIRVLPDENRDAAVKALSEIFDVSTQVSRIRLSEWFPAGTGQGFL
jgi:hypothetical protein